VTDALGHATETRGDLRPLVEVRDLTIEFQRRGRPTLKAVDGVDLWIDQGETVGLVGESGSGKTTLGRAILGLLPINAGRVYFDGTDITYAGARARRSLSAELQVIFQDPRSSMNPAKRVGKTLAEPLGVHERSSRSETARKVAEQLQRVGLAPETAHRYPSDFSGGQRQRIAIARALMVSPRLIICDEPTSALDLSVQAQVLNLLRRLQSDLSLSYLFISHNLGIVRYMSHRVYVLYAGRVMECGPAASVHDAPAHPYTKALIAATLVPDPDAQAERRRRRLASRATSLAAGPPSRGCPFAPRCPDRLDVCWEERPLLRRSPGGTEVACHLVETVADTQPGVNGSNSEPLDF
jgi:peptide/nickel transport system ATP-binding protein